MDTEFPQSSWNRRRKRKERNNFKKPQQQPPLCTRSEILLNKKQNDPSRKLLSFSILLRIFAKWSNIGYTPVFILNRFRFWGILINEDFLYVTSNCQCSYAMVMQCAHDILLYNVCDVWCEIAAFTFNLMYQWLQVAGKFSAMRMHLRSSTSFCIKHTHFCVVDDRTLWSLGVLDVLGVVSFWCTYLHSLLCILFQIPFVCVCVRVLVLSLLSFTSLSYRWTYTLCVRFILDAWTEQQTNKSSLWKFTLKQLSLASTSTSEPNEQLATFHYLFQFISISFSFGCQIDTSFPLPRLLYMYQCARRSAMKKEGKKKWKKKKQQRKSQNRQRVGFCEHERTLDHTTWRKILCALKCSTFETYKLLI